MGEALSDLLPAPTYRQRYDDSGDAGCHAGRLCRAGLRRESGLSAGKPSHLWPVVTGGQRGDVVRWEQGARRPDAGGEDTPG